MSETIDNEWPDIEVEKKFDWSLSFKELQRIYGEKGVQRKPRKKIQSRWPIDSEPYYKISTEKKIEKIRQQLGWPEERKRRSPEEWLSKWEAEPEPNFHEPIEPNEFIVRLNSHNSTFFINEQNPRNLHLQIKTIHRNP